MKRILFIIVFLTCFYGFSQIPAPVVDAVRFNAKTEAQMLAFTRMTEGTACFREDTDSIWIYDGTQWNDTGSGSLTDAQIKTAYENNPDTNAFTDAEKTKLANTVEGPHTVDTKNNQAETAANVTAEWPNLDTDGTDDFNNPGTANLDLNGFEILGVSQFELTNGVNSIDFVFNGINNLELSPDGSFSNSLAYLYPTNEWVWGGDVLVTESNAASLGLATAADYLPLAGGTMTGDLVLDGNDILGVELLNFYKQGTSNVNLAVLASTFGASILNPLAASTTGITILDSGSVGIDGSPYFFDYAGNGDKILTINNDGLVGFQDIPSGSGSGLPTTTNYSTLALIPSPSDGDAVYVTGDFGSPGTAGTFVYDSSQSATDDEGSIISGWVRQFDGEYLRPQWFGAVMDGTTDDRDAFVKTLAAANTRGLKVMLDKDIFLDVFAVGTKSIFLDDNTWIEGEGDPKMIINHLQSNAFIAALSDNVNIKNLTIEWDGQYDATYQYTSDAAANAANQLQLGNYLTANRGITLNSSNPAWSGPIALMAAFLIDAATNVTFDNVTFKAKGTTADRFMVWGIKLKEEWEEGSTVNSGVGTTAIPTNITLNNVTMDGVLMGIQGIVNGFKSDGLVGLRYSDAQTAAGGNIGGDHVGDGSSYWMPPPHLIYLNDDGSSTHNPQNEEILNTIDYGIYVGAAGVRQTVSGYCNSFKFTDNHTNLTVRNYKSYRRDGLGDLDNITNGVFEDIYSESTISIFDPTFSFRSLRFLGDLDHVDFRNVTLRDNSTTLALYPFNDFDADHVTYDGFHVFVKELNTTEHGPFGMDGSNNKITNSSLNIETHSSTQTYRGLIDQTSSRSSGANNYFDIEVNGWRDVSANPRELFSRMLFVSEENPNKNYARVRDVSNSAILENINGEVRQRMTYTELVDLGAGMSQAITINIPRYFTLQKVTAETVTDLAAGQTVTIGEATTNDLISSVPLTEGIVSNVMGEINPDTGSNRTVTIHTDTDFASTGQIKVTLELERITNERDFVISATAATVTGLNILDETIQTVDLDDDAVSTVKVLDGAITQAKLEAAIQTILNAAVQSDDTSYLGFDRVPWIGSGTQAEYDALVSPPSENLYVITDKAPAETGTGTALEMSGFYQYNFGAASSSTTFTMNDIRAGGYAETLINTTSEPTVTGATKRTGGTDWVTGTDMVLHVKDYDGTRKFWFSLW